MLAVFLVASPSFAAETNRRFAPLTVALLMFEDSTQDRETAHWRHGMTRLLHDQLGEVKTVRMLSQGATDFAQRQVGVDPGEATTAAQARKMGELIEARRVVWGSHRLENGKCQALVRVLNVASGKVSSELKAEATDWFDLRDQLGAQILAELGVKPSREERRKLAERETKSFLAWEWYSKGLALQADKEPLPEQEAAFRQSIVADPQFAKGHLGLASALGRQGRMEAAVEAVRQALQLQPQMAEAHLVLGTLMMGQEKFTEAEKAFRAARSLDPDDAKILLRLGELRAAENNLDEAISCWKEALALDPFDGLVHAHLGGAFARKGQGGLAILELKDAEHFDPDAVGTEQIIARGYDALHDTRAALEHHEKFVALARKQGGSPEQFEQLEERARELRAKLTPQPVKAAKPKVYNEETLATALRERLNAEELKLARDPMATTPEMKRVAETLTAGASGELDKAQKLFRALARHLDSGSGGSRTAQEVFSGWNDPRLSFQCQEYARFYVALARAVGLSAFFTLVDRDHTGKSVSHACACVFAEGQAWLADPSYRWFGIPHQGFAVLDDWQTLAVHLHQQSGDLPRLRLAVKLEPASAMAQFNLAMALMSDRSLNEARLVLQTGLRLEPDSWRAHCAQGYLAGWEGRWPQAIEHLRRAVALNPDGDNSRFFLAEALRTRGQFAEAREEYRGFLRSQSGSGFTEPARRAIAQINEKLGVE